MGQVMKSVGPLGARSQKMDKEGTPKLGAPKRSENTNFFWSEFVLLPLLPSDQLSVEWKDLGP